jgi:hypothetical protein
MNWKSVVLVGIFIFQRSCIPASVDLHLAIDAEISENSWLSQYSQ